MRIAILSRNENLYSTRRLKEAGEARGHQVDIIDTLHCYMDITSSNSKVRYMGEELPQYDAVIPRIGSSITFYGTAVVRQFEMMGTFCVNESVAISRHIPRNVHGCLNDEVSHFGLEFGRKKKIAALDDEYRSVLLNAGIKML